MNKIEFSEHFDKLNRMEWTTIRKGNPENLEKYQEHIHEAFEVFIKGESCGLAVLKDVSILSGKDIPFRVLIDDISIKSRAPMEWYRKIRAMPECLLLTFNSLVSPMNEVYI